MRHLATCLAAAGLLVLVGCEMKWTNPFERSATPEAETPTDETSAAEGDENLMLEGHSINVRINGVPTRPGTKAGARQIWTTEPVTGTPTLLFMTNESKLGVFQKASLTIETTIDGAEQPGDTWVYTGGAALRPGKAVRLDHFTHIVDGKASFDQPALSAGTYRLGLRVQGEKTWDIQYIDLTVN